MENKRQLNLNFEAESKILMLKKAISEIKSRQSYPYYKYEPSSPKHARFHTCGKKIRIFKGGTRAGKTTAAIMDIIKVCLGEHDYCKMELPAVFWVVCSTYKKIYQDDGMLSKFKEILPMNRVLKIISDKQKGDFCIEFDNGSSIIFKSQEEDSKAFKSSKISGALIDERIESQDIRTDIRMRIIDKKGILIFTMDSFEEDEWVNELAQHEWAEIFPVTMEDNAKYLPAEEIEMVKRELTDEEREKAFYGRYLNKDYTYVFLSSIWTESNYVEIKPSRFVINANTFEFEPSETGELRIFKKPEQGVQYVIGCDTAEGVGKNPHCLQVISEHGEQVATFLSNNINFTRLHNYIIALAKYYNRGLVIPEANNYGNTVLANLLANYNNIYYEIPVGAKINSLRQNKFGVFTQEDTKKDMAFQTLDDIENEKILIHDMLTKRQLENFIKDSSLKKNGAKYRGLKMKFTPEDFKLYPESDIRLFKNSDDDLVMSLLFADRALNNYNYLKHSRKKINNITDIDNIKPKVVISQPTEYVWGAY